MAPEVGQWLPCAACKGCTEELAKDPSEALPLATSYCSNAKWVPAKPGQSSRKLGAKKRVRKLSKKAQLWANYHKQLDDIKKASFFKPRKPKAPPDNSNPNHEA